MNNNLVKIIVCNTDNRFINYLIYNNIKYSLLEKYNNSFLLITDYSFYEKISRRYETKIINYYGKKLLINLIKTEKFMLISVFIGLLLLKLLTNTIFKITINTDDDDLKNIINNALKVNEIDVYKSKKSFKEIKKIKDKILNENEDNLEWIEIVNKGSSYEVNVTKRVKGNTDSPSKKKTNIIAAKDGLIMHITSTKGQKLKDINDYVKKGEVIITGNIIKGEDKIVDQIEAKGEVYAEVWYTVKVTIPYEYIEYVDTGKVINHYYIELFGKKMTIIGKFDSNKTMNEKELILDKPYLLFKLYKERKTVYEYKTFNIDEKEAYNEAIKRSVSIIEKKLDDKEYIISKNVLKKEAFSSKINVEVFFKVYENIGITSIIKDIGEKDGASN